MKGLHLPSAQHCTRLKERRQYQNQPHQWLCNDVDYLFFVFISLRFWLKSDLLGCENQRLVSRSLLAFSRTTESTLLKSASQHINTPERS